MSVTEILEELPKLKLEERDLVLQRLEELKGKPKRVTGAELAKALKDWPRLSPEEAEAFARDIEEGRKFFKPYVSPWDS